MRKSYPHYSIISGLAIPATKPIIITTPYEQEQDRKLFASLSALCVTEEKADLMLDSLITTLKVKEPSSFIVCDSLPKQT